MRLVRGTTRAGQMTSERPRAAGAKPHSSSTNPSYARVLTATKIATKLKNATVRTSYGALLTCIYSYCIV